MTEPTYAPASVASAPVASAPAARAGFAAVVVAAGAGTRFGADRPKALLELAGRPLVRHAVSAMLDAGALPVVVVVPDGWQQAFSAALDGLGVTLVSGGVERTHSVRHGLGALDRLGGEPGIVLVHDAARPLVPQTVIARVVAAVAEGAPAVVPAVPVTDTVRELAADPADGSRMLDRARLRAVQTPQGFDRTVLTRCYAELGEAVITDDAGVCERQGYPVALVEGSAASFKITYPADLLVAERLIHDQQRHDHEVDDQQAHDQEPDTEAVRTR